MESMMHVAYRKRFQSFNLILVYESKANQITENSVSRILIGHKYFNGWDETHLKKLQMMLGSHEKVKKTLKNYTEKGKETLRSRLKGSKGQDNAMEKLSKS